MEIAPTGFLLRLHPLRLDPFYFYLSAFRSLLKLIEGVVLLVFHCLCNLKLEQQRDRQKKMTTFPFFFFAFDVFDIWSLRKFSINHSPLSHWTWKSFPFYLSSQKITEPYYHYYQKCLMSFKNLLTNLQIMLARERKLCLFLVRTF